MQNSAQKVVLINILLLVCVTLAFLFSQTRVFDTYSLQVFSLIAFAYVLVQFSSSKIKGVKQYKSIFDFSILTIAIVLFIAMTGYLSSPLFFLIYFLVFAVSLLLHPSAALTIAFTSSVLLLATPKKDLVSELMQLSSLFLITPLALMFGTQYAKLQQEKDKADLLKNDEKKLVREVVSQEKKVREWTTGEFKNGLIKIWENIDKVTKDADLTLNQKTKLSEISNQLSNLLKSGEEMKKEIEK